MKQNIIVSEQNPENYQLNFLGTDAIRNYAVNQTVSLN
jgi:hypothetical protein